jgi:competence protein ComEC
MGGLSILAQQIGRRQHGVNAAALASLIMILIDPHLPWDISYQLSISATLGLILYADPLSNWFSNFSSRFIPFDVVQKITQPISEYFLFTIAAQMMTFPVMLYHFHAFSISTFLANPAILPAQPPIMLVGGLALILALIWYPLGKLTAPLVYPFVLYTIRVVEWFSTLSIQAWHTGDIGMGWILFIYFMIGMITFGGRWLIFLESLLTPALVSTGLGLILILIWRGIFSAPDGYLHIYFFDVGTGSAIYLITPSGQRILINGGPSSKSLSDQLGRRQPPFNRELDLILIASPTPRDIDALPMILPRFPPKRVFWLGDESLCWEAENLRVELENTALPIKHGQPGETFELGDGVSIQVLTENPRGGSILIKHKCFRGLLPFGMSKAYQEGTRMGLDLGEMTLLLLSDNGYQSSNPPEWIKNLNPQLILLSVGIKDSQGLPDRTLIARLAGYSLLRTDQHGTVHISTDGSQMWIHVEKLE